MKKKLISMLLAGTMVLSLAACGGGGSTGGDSGDGGDDAGSAEMGTSDDENTLTVAAWRLRLTTRRMLIQTLFLISKSRAVLRMLRLPSQQRLLQASMRHCRIWSCSRITGSRSL